MSRGHNIVKKFLQKRGAWDNNPYKDDKPKEKQMEPKKTRPADWAQSLAAEATVKIKQPGYNPPEQETIMNKEAEPAIKAAANAGSPRFVDLTGIIKKDKKVAEEATASIKVKNYNPGGPSDRKDSAQLDSVKADTNRTVNATGEAKANRSNSGAAELMKQNASSKSIRDLMANLGIENKPAVQEAVAVDAEPPFDKPYKKVVGTVTDKSGAKHSPMSRVRDLARKGMQQMIKINPKIGESWDNHTLEQIAEVHPAVLAMAKVAGKQSLKAKADQHTELALAANRAGDDEKVRYHQAQVAKIKAQMQTAQAEGYIDYTRPSGAAYDATMVKGKMVITPNKPYEPYGAAPAKKKVTKLPMSQAAGALAAEEVEELDELSGETYKKYLHRAVGVGSGDAEYKEKTPGYKTKGDSNSLIAHKQDHEDSKYDPQTHRDSIVHAKQKMHKRKQGIDRAVDKLVAKNPANKLSGRYIKATTGLKHKHGVVAVKAPEGNPSATTPYEHPKETGAQNNRITRARGRSRTTGVHRAIERIKEENLDELKLATMQSYADKAHQQAMDATYDAAHLNRPGEEKLKADAKRLASKRAGGVQLAQTKMDRMSEELEDQKPMTFAHGIADIVTCKRTHRDAVVQSVEGDNYTVVYADGSTETGPADYWTNTRPVNEARVVEQPRAWNVRTLKPAGHGIVGKKVRSYDFPGIHDSHYVEGHVTDEDPQSYHIRTTKVVRHHKEEPIPAHLTHIRAPKGLHIFGNAPGVYYAPREQKPVAKPNMRSLRGKK